jgi:hypothetical protein
MSGVVGGCEGLDITYAVALIRHERIRRCSDDTGTNGKVIDRQFRA